VSRAAFVGALLVGVVVHLRHDEPSAIVLLALEDIERVVVPYFDLIPTDQLLDVDLQMGVDKENLGMSTRKLVSGGATSGGVNPFGQIVPMDWMSRGGTDRFRRNPGPTDDDGASLPAVGRTPTRQEYRGRVLQMTNPSSTIAVRYLQALSRHDWDEVTSCLARDVVRRGPFGDDFEGVTTYVSFLQSTMPSLPGYRMDIDKVTALVDQRIMIELRETIEVDGRPLVTHECLVFDVDPDGLIEEICVYIRQAPKG
jgi:ketosteroid isomerase-like protein